MDSLVNDMDKLAEVVMQRCDELAAISQSETGLDRQYLTQEHQQANECVAGWMHKAGMKTHVDGAGNLLGRYESDAPHAKRLLIGSHLDTVPNGGKYDGMLGVITPLMLVQYLHDAQIRFPFHIDIVGFCDEEGTRFGTTLLGSRALTGKWQQSWADLPDKQRITLRQAMHDFGLDFDKVSSCTIRQPEELIGYLEWHIEQGPVLEANDLPVGVVTAIAGARRLMVNVTGFAGHAGTVPMGLRQDALAASCEMILAVEDIAKHANVVATVGQIQNRPNGVNVISGSTQFSLDIRSENDELRDTTLSKILNQFEQIALRRNVAIEHNETHCAPAVKCDSALKSVISKAIQQAGYPVHSLLSGAGHDAMAMAEICPVAMLFIRCEKGISHHPKESIISSDVAAGLQVLLHTLNELAVLNKAQDHIPIGATS